MTAQFEELCAAWLTDFATRGVDRIGFGVITVQRPSDHRSTWRELEEVRTPVAREMRSTVLAGLRARTWLSMHTDAEVLSLPWSVAQDVTEERVGSPGAPDPSVIQLRQGGGCGGRSGSTLGPRGWWVPATGSSPPISWCGA